jgi:hypothetical protein
MDKYDFRFDAEVYGRDKKLGHLAKLVINPITRQVTHMVVSEGFIFKRETVLPVAALECLESGETRFALTAAELATYPPFSEIVVQKGAVSLEAAAMPATAQEVQVLPPNYGVTQATQHPIEQEVVRMGIEPEAVVWHGKTAVYSQDGAVGTLSHVITAAGPCQLLELVITRGSLPPRHLVIPADILEKPGEHTIKINATTTEVDNFAEYFVHQSDAPQV